jgi:hypothetical protein
MTKKVPKIKEFKGKLKQAIKEMRITRALTAETIQTSRYEQISSGQ